MTEYETILLKIEAANLAAQLMASAMASMGLYITVVSGYLIISYLVGAKLSKMQNIIVSILFITSALFMILGVYLHMQRAHYWANLYSSNPNVYLYSVVCTSIFLMGIIAALKFMHDIRKNKVSDI